MPAAPSKGGPRPPPLTPLHTPSASAGAPGAAERRRGLTGGVVYMPDKEKVIKCYVDSEFSVGWSQADSNNAENNMSHTGYIIMYAGCPVLWCSKLKLEIASSTKEAEYTAFIQAMSNVIPFMMLMKEISLIFDKHITKPEVFCKVFEDSQICIAVTSSTFFTDNKTHCC